MFDEAALLSLLLFFKRSLVHEFPFSSEFSPKSKRNASLEYQNKKKQKKIAVNRLVFVTYLFMFFS